MQRNSRWGNLIKPIPEFNKTQVPNFKTQNFEFWRARPRKKDVLSGRSFQARKPGYGCAILLERIKHINLLHYRASPTQQHVVNFAKTDQ